MSKLFLFVAIAVVAALWFGGALEIKFHTEELANVPGRVMAYFQESGLYDKGVAQLDRFKKDGTTKLIENYTKSGEVAGSKDEASPTPTPKSEIPLQF